MIKKINEQLLFVIFSKLMLIDLMKLI